MSSPATVAVECDVPTAQTVTAFVHRLGGPVDVIGFDAEGDRVGVIVNPITADEVEVIDPTGTAVRLRATPAADEDDAQPETD